MAGPLRFGRFEIRPAERVLLADATPVALGPRAFDLLVALIERRDRVVAKDELLGTAWQGLVVGESNLHAQISNLRQALGPNVIATIPARGYRFVAPVEGAAEPPADAVASVPAAADRVLRFGPIELRPAERGLTLAGQPVAVGARAFELLLALASRPGQVVAKQALLDEVWAGRMVEEGNLQTQMSALRKVLGAEIVQTVPGIGYRFMPAEPIAAGPLPLPRASGWFEGRTNLPAAAEALVGRTEAMEALGDALARHRLVTIIGIGGVGKTSLADSVARDRVAGFADGVWWVDLAGLNAVDTMAGGSAQGKPVDANSAELGAAQRVAAAVANAVGLGLGEGDSTELLASALADRQTLLVLDNCEHLVAAVAALAERLLAAAPGLRLLATSQEPLRVQVEHVFRLSGLAVPPRGCTLDTARDFGAVLLLEQRARAADPRFALGADNLDRVIALCEQLDGIALAIEMAAARLPLLGLATLEANLGQRLRLLRSHRRSAPARQQTLLATLEWTCSLLGADEQAMLTCLGVFAGSFGLAAAQEIGAASTIDAWAVVDALSGLVDHSILGVVSQDPPRYRLLESTRLFARERLAASGHADAIERQHGRILARLAGEAEDDYWRQPDAPWLARYAPDYADLALALERACRALDGSVAARVLLALFRLDHLRANFAPILPHLALAEALLPTVVDPADRARIQVALSDPLLRIPKLAAAREAVALCAERDDLRWHCLSLLNLAQNLSFAGDLDGAHESVRQARALEGAHWTPRLRWLSALAEAFAFSFAGNTPAYRQATREALEFAELAGSPCQAANARLNLADVALMAGDYAEAAVLGRAAVAECAALGMPTMLAIALNNLCATCLRLGDADGAAEFGARALPLLWRDSMSGYLATHLALLAALRGDHEAAGELHGHVDAWLAGSGRTLEPNERLSLDQARGAVVTARGAAGFEALRRVGTTLGDEAARRLAERMLDGGEADEPPAHRPQGRATG